MNVGDRVRVADDDSAIEGTVTETWIVSGNLYVKVRYLGNCYLSLSASNFEVSVLVPAEPVELGTVFKDADGFDYVKWSNLADIRQNWIGVLSGNHYSWEEIPK